MTHSLSRRSMLRGAAAGAATLAMPYVARAQVPEMLVRGAAPDTTWMKTRFIPAFEQKHNVKVLYEGAIATINLEKLRSEKAKPQTSVILLGGSRTSSCPIWPSSGPTTYAATAGGATRAGSGSASRSTRRKIR